MNRFSCDEVKAGLEYAKKQTATLPQLLVRVARGLVFCCLLYDNFRAYATGLL